MAQAVQWCTTGTPNTPYVNGRVGIMARYGIQAAMNAFGAGVSAIHSMQRAQYSWANAMSMIRNASGTTGDGTQFVWYDTITQQTWALAPNVLMNTSLGRLQWQGGYPVRDQLQTSWA